MYVQVYTQLDDTAHEAQDESYTDTSTWRIGYFYFAQLGKMLDMVFEIFENQDYETDYFPNWLNARKHTQRLLSQEVDADNIMKLGVIQETIEMVLNNNAKNYYLKWYVE